MKAAISEGKGDIRLVEVAIPEPGPYQCLCKTLACATCTGTDLKIISGKFPKNAKYPGIVGHESVGTVLKIGAKVKYIKKGDMYLRPTAVYNGTMFGGYSSLWGGFAEYGLVTDTRALFEENPKANPGYAQYQMEIPGDIKISAPEATMVITLKETAGYVMDMKVALNNSVVVLGSGPVAMSMCFFAKICGAFPLIVVGRRDEPLNYIKMFGANFTVNNEKEDMVRRVSAITNGQGVDYIMDAAGDEELFTESCKMLAENGKIAPYALFTKRDDVFKGIDPKKILNAKTGEVPTHNYMLDLLRLNLLNLKRFYSHTMPFSDISKGFEMIKKKEASKIVFEM